MYHVETFEFLLNERKSHVRRYLMQMGDSERLRAYDNGSFKEGDD